MATQAIELDKDAFMRLVTQEHLQVEGPSQGYLYTGKQGKNGWEVYKTPGAVRRFWSYRQVCTQDNVAGGNLVVRITGQSSSGFKINTMQWKASGNRAIGGNLADSAGNNILQMFAQGATAGAYANEPSTGTTPNTTGNIPQTTDCLVVSPNYLTAYVTTAAQTETATLAITAELFGTETAPTVSWAASGGTPNAATATESRIITVPV